MGLHVRGAFSWLRQRPPTEGFVLAVSVLAFIFAAILRLYDFTGGFQYADASLYNHWAAGGSWAIGDVAIPWFQIYVTRAVFTILGVSEFSSRVYPAVCGLVLLLAVYLLGWRVSGGYGGLLSMLIVALSPYTIQFSRVNGLDVPLALYLTLAAFYSSKALGSARASALCGVFCGLAFFTKYTGLVGLALSAYPILRGRWRSALIQLAAFGLVTAPLWFQLVLLSFGPFHSHIALGEANSTWITVGDVLTGLFRDAGLFLPVGVGAVIIAALSRRLDRRIIPAFILLFALIALFVLVRRWNPWYVVDFLPLFAVITGYSVVKVSAFTPKVLRFCLVVGLVGLLVLNSFSAVNFVAGFTNDNSWKIVGKVAQGYAEVYNCSIVSRDWEALWYFRNMSWHWMGDGWLTHDRPARFIMVSYAWYLQSAIDPYLQAYGLTYHPVVLWRSSTDEVTVWLFLSGQNS